MLIYYCLTIIVNIIAALIFHKNINITGLSIIPLLLIALMIFQAKLFKSEMVENGLQIKFGLKLTENEERDMYDSSSKFLLAIIPFMIPFVLFFSSFTKILSFLIYILGLTGGPLIYRLKNRGEIYSRMDSEAQERKEQEKKEELGKWK